MASQGQGPRFDFTGKLCTPHLVKHTPHPFTLILTATLKGTSKPITIRRQRTVFDDFWALMGRLEVIDAISSATVFYDDIEICGPTINGPPMDMAHADDFITLWPGKPHIFEIDLTPWRKESYRQTLDVSVQVGKKYRMRFRREREDLAPDGISFWVWGDKKEVLLSRFWMRLGYKAPLAVEMMYDPSASGDIATDFLEPVEFEVVGEEPGSQQTVRTTNMKSEELRS